jgi:hypothetical protein
MLKKSAKSVAIILALALLFTAAAPLGGASAVLAAFTPNAAEPILTETGESAIEEIQVGNLVYSEDPV